MRLNNQVALVTGSTSGIGEAIAKRFAREGAKVAIVGRSGERGNRIAEEIAKEGGVSAFFAADLTSDTDVRKLAAAVHGHFGWLDIVVNNAGAVIPGDVMQIDLEKWERTFQANVTSAYLVSHYILPYMLEQKSGSIIHISSEAGLKGLQNRSAYCAAKAALVGLTKAMAVDHSPDGIRVNCICPGTIETPMIKDMLKRHQNPKELMDQFLQRRLTPYLGTPEQIAEAALYFALPENLYVTGAILSVDGGSLAK